MLTLLRQLLWRLLWRRSTPTTVTTADVVAVVGAAEFARFKLHYCIALQHLLTPHQLFGEVRCYRSPKIAIAKFPKYRSLRKVFVARDRARAVR
ncbi:hypothetical protein IQ269_27550 [Tychonema sp. LEGE 07199]|uniref:hypothetical protein n=1 Tax=unclassified Tychonema TaxID=2642144 RepID=UPI00187FBC1B|nr:MULTISPECIES: hypothetical protein [unclassified Tychonema]MBE9124431.1 hypothetical protein [Tychonema sp. LEGE 07199]MBE9133703.1 hypothetical protein [Tychonema sp. LEGE 07196]